MSLALQQLVVTDHLLRFLKVNAVVMQVYVLQDPSLLITILAHLDTPQQ